MELYHPDKMLHIFSAQFCLLVMADETTADILVAHCVSSFPELSDMPAVMA